MNNGKIIEYTHGGNLEAARQKYGKKRFLDLCVNINPWGPSARFWFELLVNLGRVKEYPEPYSERGRRFLANFFNLTKDYLLLGNGAAELIGALPQALPVQRAVILVPTFTEYRRAFEAVGKEVRLIKLTDTFEIPFDQVALELKQGDLLFVCQPNNPVGKLYERDILLELLKLVEARQSWLVVDESFLWFCSEIQRTSLACLVNAHPTLVIINSLTKIAGLPGLRIGFAIGAPKTIEMISRVLNQWNLNSLAQQMIKPTLNRRFLQRTKQRLALENRWLLEQLTQFEAFTVYPWDANFYLIKVKKGLLGSKLLSQLADFGILARDCSNFEGLNGDFIRFAVGRRSQNRRLIKILKRVMGHAKAR